MSMYLRYLYMIQTHTYMDVCTYFHTQPVTYKYIYILSITIKKSHNDLTVCQRYEYPAGAQIQESDQPRIAEW